MTENMDLVVSLVGGDMLIIDEVDRIVEQSVAAGIPDAAFKFARGMRRNMQAQGIAIAKLLWELHEQWHLFEAAGIETPFEIAVQTEVGLAVATTSKYVGMYGALFANPSVPDHIKDTLLGKPIKSLLLLTAGASEGAFDDEMWNEIARCSSGTEISKVVKEARGAHTSSSSRLILMLDRTGTLRAKANERTVDIGWLNVAEQDEDVKRGIQRLVTSAGILEV